MLIITPTRQLEIVPLFPHNYSTHYTKTWWLKTEITPLRKNKANQNEKYYYRMKKKKKKIDSFIVSLRFQTIYRFIILSTCSWTCWEEENLVFWFGTQFNSTLNFTQSEWLILFSPDLHFWLAKRVSGQTQSLRRETATRTDVPLVVPT